MNREPVVIVGGGWAGIACAVELAESGTPVTLLESARQLGGRARGVDWNGARIDNGQHLMVGAYRETLRLMASLGTLERLERHPLDLRVPGFRLRLPRLPAPLHLAAGLLTAKGLDLAEKLAAIRFMQALKQVGFRLDRDMAADRLLAAYRQPQGLIGKLWAPICIAALNTPLEAASAQVFCNVLKDSLMGPRADSDLVMTRGDLGRLVPEAAMGNLQSRGVKVLLNNKVAGICLDGGRYRLAGPDLETRRLVLAVHPARIPSLVAELPQLAASAEQIAGYTWQPILTLWLRFATPPVFPFPMLGLGEGQAPWAFERNDLAPGMVAMVESAQGPHLEQAPAALLESYLDLLQQALGPLPPLLDWKTIVEKRATYTCGPDLYRPDNRTALPGLFLAGDYTAGPYPATLEGAVRSGVECARLLLEPT